MGVPGRVLSAIAAAVGAILYWAVTYQGTGFRLSIVGLMLTIAGAFGFVVSSIVFSTSRRPVSTDGQSMDCQVNDSQGRSSSVHEESKKWFPVQVELTLLTNKIPYR